jgi:hypothetical protein
LAVADDERGLVVRTTILPMQLRLVVEEFRPLVGEVNEALEHCGLVLGQAEVRTHHSEVVPVRASTRSGGWRATALAVIA